MGFIGRPKPTYSKSFELNHGKEFAEKLLQFQLGVWEINTRNHSFSENGEEIYPSKYIQHFCPSRGVIELDIDKQNVPVHLQEPIKEIREYFQKTFRTSSP